MSSFLPKKAFQFKEDSSSPRGGENHSPLEKTSTVIPLEKKWVGISKSFETIQGITHRDIALLVKHRDTKVIELTGPTTGEQGFVRDILDLAVKGLLVETPEEFIPLFSEDKTVEVFAYEVAESYLLSCPVHKKEALDVLLDKALEELKEIYALREAEKKRKVKPEAEEPEAESEPIGLDILLDRKQEVENGEVSDTEEVKARIKKNTPKSLDLAGKFYISFGNDWSPIANASVLRGAKISAARLSNGLLDRKEVKVGILKDGNIEVCGVRKNNSDKWEDEFEREIFPLPVGPIHHK